MLVALVSTKIPILLGRDFWIFHVQDLKRYDLSKLTAIAPPQTT